MQNVKAGKKIERKKPSYTCKSYTFMLHVLNFTTVKILVFKSAKGLRSNRITKPG